jgi:ring-1,2-phenylacetyl-CoA epoxidase subunit PaaD
VIDLLDPEALPLESVVRARLAEVDDPEIPGVSIVELGLVYRVQTSPGSIEVELLPTFVGCPALDVIQATVSDRLADLAPSVDVHFTFDVPWTSERISEAGRAALRGRGYAPPILSPGSDPEARARRALPLLPLISMPIAECPFCGSRRATLENAFGPTLCRAIYYGADCRQPFEQLKAV